MKNNQNKYVILIVDDNPQNIQVLGHLLDDSGYEPVVAMSGMEALKYLKKDRPDLILLDVMMPQMNGYEVCEVIKENNNTAGIPIIFLTAKIDTEDIIKGFDVGAVDYITKPFNTTELLARIKTHVSLKEMQNMLETQNQILQYRNKEMDEQLRLAGRIQQQLIPEKDPSDNISSFYYPMEKIGGDFFDYLFFRDNDDIGIFISDVSGHGVPAAFVTSMVKTVILQAGKKRDNPRELLNYLNEILLDNVGINFLTAFYGIYSPQNRKMIYSNAGHNPPFIITDSEIIPINGNSSIPLALYNETYLQENGKSLTNSHIELDVNTKILFYTDGLSDVAHRDNPEFFFGDAMLEKVLIKNFSQPCVNFVSLLFDELTVFKGDNKFDDDVCVICLDII